MSEYTAISEWDKVQIHIHNDQYGSTIDLTPAEAKIFAAEINAAALKAEQNEDV